MFGQAKIRYHVVKPGETLATISKDYYGDEKYLAAIYQANRQYIDNMNQIFPLQKLAIPYLTIHRD